MNKARELDGPKMVCKTGIWSSTLPRASTKYKSLSEMHWFWRYIYWPYKQVRFKYIDHPLIKNTNAFMKPLHNMREMTLRALAERDEWKNKYIEISKENAKLRRKQK